MTCRPPRPLGGKSNWEGLAKGLLKSHKTLVLNCALRSYKCVRKKCHAAMLKPTMQCSENCYQAKIISMHTSQDSVMLMLASIVPAEYCLVVENVFSMRSEFLKRSNLFPKP